MQEYQEIQIDESDALMDRRVSHWRGRLFVFAFMLSVCAFLAALWFSGILVSAPDSLLPNSFLQFVDDYRFLALLVPSLCLVACYGVLRSLTGEIMAVPEHYLDERQQMLRDQAHRSAFKIIKLAGVIIPVCLLLPHLPWFNFTPADSPHSLKAAYHPLSVLIYKIGAQPVPIVIHYQDHGQLIELDKQQPFWQPVYVNVYTKIAAVPFSHAVSTTDIILASVLLLLCLWLLFSALPMCVLAWRGRR